MNIAEKHIMDKIEIQDKLEMQMKELIARICEVETENIKYKSHLKNEIETRTEQTKRKIEQLNEALANLIERNNKGITKAVEKVAFYEDQKKELEESFKTFLDSSSDAEWKNNRMDFQNLMDQIAGDRESTIARMKIQLNEIGVKLETWNEIVNETSGETKDLMEANITLLKQKRDLLQSKLDEAVNATEETAWEGVKDGLSKVSKSLSDGCSRAFSVFSGRKRTL